MEWIWLGVIISLILVELCSLNLTAIWYVISGIISYILLKCNQDYYIQVITFIVLGTILMMISRHYLLDKFIHYRDEKLNALVKKHPFVRRLIPSEIKLDEPKKTFHLFQKDKNNVKKNKKNNAKKKHAKK